MLRVDSVHHHHYHNHNHHHHHDHHHQHHHHHQLHPMTGSRATYHRAKLTRIIFIHLLMKPGASIESESCPWFCWLKLVATIVSDVILKPIGHYPHHSRICSLASESAIHQFRTSVLSPKGGSLCAIPVVSNLWDPMSINETRWASTSLNEIQFVSNDHVWISLIYYILTSWAI